MASHRSKTRTAARRRPLHEHVAFPRREDRPERIEVHVAGVCIRRANGAWKILTAKRAPDRSLFPNMWECGGGMVRPGESFEAAVKRQIFEEFGLRVEPVQVIEVYEIPIRSGQRIIPGVRFLCQARAGRIRLNKREFTTYRWLSVPLKEQLDWISGLEEVVQTVGKRLAEDVVAPSLPQKRPLGFR